MPRNMSEEYDKLARRLAKNRSALFREMFVTYKRQYLKEEFRELQTYGTAWFKKEGSTQSLMLKNWFSKHASFLKIVFDTNIYILTSSYLVEMPKKSIFTLLIISISNVATVLKTAPWLKVLSDDPDNRILECALKSVIERYQLPDAPDPFFEK